MIPLTSSVRIFARVAMRLEGMERKTRRQREKPHYDRATSVSNDIVRSRCSVINSQLHEDSFRRTRRDGREFPNCSPHDPPSGLPRIIYDGASRRDQNSVS